MLMPEIIASTMRLSKSNTIVNIDGGDANGDVGESSSDVVVKPRAKTRPRRTTKACPLFITKRKSRIPSKERPTSTYTNTPSITASPAVKKSTQLIDVRQLEKDYVGTSEFERVSKKRRRDDVELDGRKEEKKFKMEIADAESLESASKNRDDGVTFNITEKALLKNLFVNTLYRVETYSGQCPHCLEHSRYVKQSGYDVCRNKRWNTYRKMRSHDRMCIYFGVSESTMRASMDNIIEKIIHTFTITKDIRGGNLRAGDNLIYLFKNLLAFLLFSSAKIKIQNGHIYLFSNLHSELKRRFHSKNAQVAAWDLSNRLDGNDDLVKSINGASYFSDDASKKKSLEERRRIFHVYVESKIYWDADDKFHKSLDYIKYLFDIPTFKNHGGSNTMAKNCDLSPNSADGVLNQKIIHKYTARMKNWKNNSATSDSRTGVCNSNQSSLDYYSPTGSNVQHGDDDEVDDGECDASQDVYDIYGGHDTDDGDDAYGDGDGDHNVDIILQSEVMRASPTEADMAIRINSGTTRRGLRATKPRNIGGGGGKSENDDGDELSRYRNPFNMAFQLHQMFKISIDGLIANPEEQLKDHKEGIANGDGTRPFQHTCQECDTKWNGNIETETVPDVCMRMFIVELLKSFIRSTSDGSASPDDVLRGLKGSPACKSQKKILSLPDRAGLVYEIFHQLVSKIMKSNKHDAGGDDTGLDELVNKSLYAALYEVYTCFYKYSTMEEIKLMETLLACYDVKNTARVHLWQLVLETLSQNHRNHFLYYPDVVYGQLENQPVLNDVF